MTYPEGTKIPIYFSNEEEDQIRVLNYMLKNADRNKSLPISSAKLKPKQQLLQLRVGIETESSHFDSARAQEIGENSNIFKNETEEEDEQPIMDSIFMKSAPSQSSSNYVLGYFKDGCLFFSRISGMSNMSIDFSYLDPVPEKTDAPEEDGEMQLVTKKFKRPENERMKKAKEKRTEEEQRRNEPWWDLTYAKSTAEFGKKELERLFPIHEVNEAAAVIPSVSEEEYDLSFLKPASLHKEANTKSNEEESLRPGLSLAELKKMKIHDMIKAFLLNVKVTSFNSLISTLTLNAARQSKETLHQLHEHAVLVQGNWVISSEVLYPKGTLCGVSGMSAETLAKARTFILLLFAHEREVKRTFVTTQTRLPSEEVTEILKQFSKRNNRNLWEFTLPTDTEFIKRHYEDVKRQNILWNQKRLVYEKEKYIVPSKPLEIPERKRNSSSRISTSD